MMPSNEPTNSVKAKSMWSRPARMMRMSELGWEYFLDRMLDKKTLRVYRELATILSSFIDEPYIQRMQWRVSSPILDRLDSSCE